MTTATDPHSPQAPAQRPTSVMAVIGFVFAFVFSPIGIVLSVLGMRDTTKNNKGGRGLAIAGLILSILGTLAWIIILLVTVIFASATVKVASDAGKSIAADQSAAKTDVQVTGCEAGDFGQVAHLTIKNTAKTSKSYMVTVSANDASGQRVGELNGVANDIAAGQTANVDAIGTLQDGATVAACTVADVNRF